jgi:aminoglycoside phosphotransferase (APT) family kinase protein
VSEGDRPGLDGAALARFLSAQEGAPVAVQGLERVRSVGNAREPWAFTAVAPDGTPERCVLLLQAAAGQLEADLGDEYRTLSALQGSGVPVPVARGADETGDVLGSPFFVTRWCAGTADTRALRREGDPEVAAVARQLAAAAGRLHGLGTGPFGHLAATTPARAALDQLDRWEALFRRHRLEPHPELEHLVAWLRRQPPVAARVALVHGDLRFGNLLRDGDRLTALLDWEMCHLGDPVEDLAWAYRALWSPERSLAFDGFLDAYVAAGGARPAPAHLRWYQVFGEVKHSVISLTAARSFADGGTRSLRHADRAATLPAFTRRGLELVDAAC